MILNKEPLMTLSKEQLIHIIDKCDHSFFLISEVCVDESKMDISSDKAVEKIRNYIYNIPSCLDEKELKAEVDYEMGKISSKEYREIILGDKR